MLSCIKLNYTLNKLRKTNKFTKFWRHSGIQNLVNTKD